MKMKMENLYPARAGERPITVEDLWRIPRVGTPCPSPTSEDVAVAVRTFDMEADRGSSRIWLVPEAGAARALTAAAHDSDQPVFAPDGESLAFVRKVDGKKQLFVLPMLGGEPEQLTTMPLGVSDPRWLPDGSGLVFVSELCAGHLTVEATRAELESRAEHPPPAIVTEERLYSFWDRFLAGGEVTHLFLLELGADRGSEPRDLTPELAGWLDLMDPSGCYDIAPDGSEIAYSHDASYGEPGEELLKSAILTVPIGGGEARGIATGRVSAQRPRYTSDGRGILYGWTDDATFYADRVRLGMFDRATGVDRDVLADWDLSPSDWELTAEGAVVFRAEIDSRACLFALDSTDGSAAPRRLTEQGSVSAPRLGRVGIAYSRQDMQSPAEVFTLPGIEGGEAIRRTSFTDSELAGISMGEVRELAFAGAEGERVQAWLVLPPGHRDGDVHPLVHVVHGGPHGITGDGFHPRWNAQLFAAPGYAVACVNFQGSTSRGQDFAKRIQGAWGDRPYRDVMAATDELVASGLVDPERMAVTGASYGGYLVSWIGTQTDRFRCIVNHAGVFDLLSQYASDVTHGRHVSFGGTPWDGIERLDRFSPSRATAGMTTPTLVLHGARDLRVPVTQGLECYNMLKAKGVPARLVLFPGENHWVLKPRASRLWYGEVLGWLERYLEPTEPSARS